MYIVIEMQASNENIATITTQHATLNEALSKYHAILSAAAISDVMYHSAVVLDHSGMSQAQMCFTHENIEQG